MKKALFLLASVFIVILGMGTQYTVYADDYEEGRYVDKDHHDDNEQLEEVGEAAGWGTVMTMFIAGLIFPIRKMTKPLLKNFPSSRTYLISFLRFLGKHHVLIGLSTLLLSLFHGVIYVSEGKLETDGVTGIMALLFMLFASLIGVYLLKNKKSKGVRTFHLVMLTGAASIGALHLLIS